MLLAASLANSHGLAKRPLLQKFDPVRSLSAVTTKFQAISLAWSKHGASTCVS